MSRKKSPFQTLNGLLDWVLVESTENVHMDLLYSINNHSLGPNKLFNFFVPQLTHIFFFSNIPTAVSTS